MSGPPHHAHGQRGHADKRSVKRRKAVDEPEFPQRQRHRLAENGAQIQRGKKQAATKARTERDCGSEKLQRKQHRQHLPRRSTHEIEMQRPVAGGQDMRRDQPQETHNPATDDRPQPDRAARKTEKIFGRRHQLHHRDGGKSAKNPQEEIRGQSRRAHCLREADFDRVLLGPQPVGRQARGE